MLERGLKPRTIWTLYGTAMEPLIKAHEACGKTGFDDEVVRAYVQKNQQRVDNGEITPNHYRVLIRGLRRLAERIIRCRKKRIT